jgi:4-carboxymuconolactone decarboxylase
VSRLTTLDRDAMTEAQRTAYDAIVQARSQVPAGGAHAGIYPSAAPVTDGTLRGPFDAWVRSPAVGRRLVSLGGALRFRTSLDPRLTELAILVTARHWTAQYEWYAHAPFARRAGVAAEVIEAIRRHERPQLERPDEEAVYALATELHTTHGVSDGTYDRARGQLGEAGVVELVALLGYYVAVSMTLNTFRVAVPGNHQPLDD